MCYQNRSVSSIAVNRAAQERWRRTDIKYSTIVDKEEGQVAQSMPHRGLCGIVRQEQLLFRTRAKLQSLLGMKTGIERGDFLSFSRARK